MFSTFIPVIISPIFIIAAFLLSLQTVFLFFFPRKQGWLGPVQRLFCPIFSIPKVWGIRCARQLLWHGSSCSILKWLCLCYCLQGLEHQWISFSMGVLELIPCRYRGTTVVKFSGSQKLYMNFWLHGVSASNPMLFKVNCIYSSVPFLGILHTFPHLREGPISFLNPSSWCTLLSSSCPIHNIQPTQPWGQLDSHLLQHLWSSKSTLTLPLRTPVLISFWIIH